MALDVVHKSRSDVKEAIRRAFRGVVLGDGVSLRQAQIIDRYGEGVTEAEFEATPRAEVTNNWEAVSLEELERDCVAHLDAEGFRYYIPAFMLSVMESYEPCSMRVIGTLMSLSPSKSDAGYHLRQQSCLSREQKGAIALFLKALPHLAELEPEDRKRVERSYARFWDEHLPRQIVGN